MNDTIQEQLGITLVPRRIRAKIMVSFPIFVKEAPDPETVLAKLTKITEGFLDCIQDLSELALSGEQREMLGKLELTAYHALLQAQDLRDDIRQGEE